MRYIMNTSTDPAFNLAAEEWLLMNTQDEVFMLWRNAPAVIVGRNQNTLAQIDEDFVRVRGIPVVRRLSGGGAVFHDLGNINFTFISNDAGGGALDFLRFTTPIVEALGRMGVSCSFDGRNDLVIDGRKVSGNAQHIAEGRVLHHGTLLFSSDVTDISGALRVDPEKYKDKAVKSVRKRVTNIADHLPEPMDVEACMARIMADVSGSAQEAATLADEEVQAIDALADSRYRTWDWNFGSSPQYGFSRTTRTPGGVVEAHVDVQSGVIRRIRLYGEYFGTRDVGDLEAELTGCRHDRDALAQVVDGISLEQYMLGVDRDTLVGCLF